MIQLNTFSHEVYNHENNSLYIYTYPTKSQTAWLA